MTMTAQVHRDYKGDITLQLKGGLDVDNTITLRNELAVLIKKYPHLQVTLDMTGVNFIGSSGIAHFVETLRLLTEKQVALKLSGVSDEFIRVFKLYNFSTTNMLLNSFDSDETSTLSQDYVGKNRTFQN